MGERRLDLALDLVPREQRHRVVVRAELAQVLRHRTFDELPRFLIGLVIVDHDLANVVGEVVAQRPDDRVAVLEDQERGRAAHHGGLDGFPDAEQVVHVPLELFRGTAHAGRPHDDAHAIRHLDILQCFPHLVAIGIADAPGHATAARIVRHQHDEAAGQADVGRQGCALVAALLLLDLDDDLLAFAQDFADVDVAAGRRLGDEILAGDFLQWQETMAL